MTSQELSMVVFLAVYGALFLGAVRIFGMRRVLVALLGIVLFAVAVALKTLGVIVSGGRRY